MTHRMEHLQYGERMKELRLFHLEKKMLPEDSAVPFTTQRELARPKETSHVTTGHDKGQQF